MADVFRLTAEQRTQLQQLQADIAPIKSTLDKLKRIGTIDVSELESRFDTAVQTREGLLREFGTMRSQQA